MLRRLVNSRDLRRLLTVAVGRNFSSSSVHDVVEDVVEDVVHAEILDVVNAQVRAEILDVVNAQVRAEILDAAIAEIRAGILDEMEHRFWYDKYDVDVVKNYEPQPMRGSCFIHSDDVNYSDDVDVFTASGPSSFRRDPAYLFKTGCFDRNLAYLFKSYLLPDMNNVTSSMIVGVDVRMKEKVWDVCGLVSTRAGTSGGFYHLSDVLSSTVGQIVQYASFSGSTSSLSWSPDASHALAVTDPFVGSRGTRNCLVSVLENNQMTEYFKNAQTKVYYLAGGNYTKFIVPGILQKMVQKVPSIAGSSNFLKKLKNKQPKHRLLGSPDTVYLLQWYYSPEKGLGFHGMWCGEIQIEHQKSFVCCIGNNLRVEPYKALIRKVEEEVSKLPQDILDEMDQVWSSRPSYCITEYAARQFVRHAVQGNEFVVDVSDYCTKATELSKILDNNKLLEIMDLDGLEWGEYHACEDLTIAVSKKAQKMVIVTFCEHPRFGVVPYSFGLLCDYKFCPISHVSIANIAETGYETFTFGEGELFE